MKDPKPIFRWFRRAGQGFFWLGITALLLALGSVLFGPSRYPTDRIILRLGSRSELAAIGLNGRTLAGTLLLIWGLPVIVSLFAVLQISRHLESGTPFRPGLIRPLRALAMAQVLAFGASMVSQDWHDAFFFPLLSFRWIWILRPILFIFIGTCFFIAAKVADEGCRLQTDHDLVV